MLDSLDTLIGFALIFTVVSLLITTLVQLASSLLNLRGRNLAWGLAESFAAIAPELEAESHARGKLLADRLLRDPLISDSQLGTWIFRAQAVRPAELFALLHGIATGKRPNGDQEIRADVVTLLKELGVPAHVFELSAADKAQLEALKANIETQLDQLPDGLAKSALLQAREDARNALTQGATSAAEAATRWAAQPKAEIQACYVKFEQWFETGQERAQEWFTTHTRILTAVLGVAAAFVLQLDAVDIFRQVSSDKELRASLVAQTTTVLEAADKILKTQPSTLQLAVSNLVSALPPAAPAGTNSSPWRGVVVAPTDKPEEVVAKIREAYRDRPESEVLQALAAFDDATEKQVRARLKNSSEDYRSLRQTLEKTGFALFPGGPDGWNRWHAELGDRCPLASHHLVGMLFSALLLSLGAPFWFNALKSLASLRSSVARNITKEETAGQNPSGPTAAVQAPPSVVG